jgi:hypothetical protein
MKTFVPDPIPILARIGSIAWLALGVACLLIGIALLFVEMVVLGLRIGAANAISEVRRLRR